MKRIALAVARLRPAGGDDAVRRPSGGYRHRPRLPCQSGCCRRGASLPPSAPMWGGAAEYAARREEYETQG